MRTYTSMPGIRARRRMLRMKSQELADALGVSRQSLSSWENGSLMPSAGILPALAEALRCRIEDLYQGEEASMDRLLTKTEVCDKLGVSRPTLDRIVAAGELDAVRIRRQVRFFEQDVLRYLSRCRSAEQPKPAAQEQKEPARRGRPKGRKTRPQPEQYVPGMRVV